MGTTYTATLEQFSAALETVRDLGTQVAALEQETTESEAAALERLVALVRPVMRYIDQPVRVAGHCPGGQFSRWEYDLLPEHAIVLHDGQRRECDNGDQNRGSYAGESLVLTRSGQLLELTHRGSWSQWQGEGSHWATTQRQLAAAQVAAEYDLPDLVDGFADAVSGAIKRAETKKQTLAGRREKLAAVQAALR